MYDDLQYKCPKCGKLLNNTTRDKINHSCKKDDLESYTLFLESKGIERYAHQFRTNVPTISDRDGIFEILSNQAKIMKKLEEIESKQNKQGDQNGV